MESADGRPTAVVEALGALKLQKKQAVDLNVTIELSFDEDFDSGSEEVPALRRPHASTARPNRVDAVESRPQFAAATSTTAEEKDGDKTGDEGSDSGDSVQTVISGGAPEKPIAEDWNEVHAHLLAAREEVRAAKRSEAAAWEALDRFVERHGAAGEKKAGAMLRAIGREKEARAVAEEHRRKALERQEAINREEAAKRGIREMRIAQLWQKREMNLKLHEAAVDRARLSGQPRPKLGTCYSCGLTGVYRGCECPSRDSHPPKGY